MKSDSVLEFIFWVGSKSTWLAVDLNTMYPGTLPLVARQAVRLPLPQGHILLLGGFSWLLHSRSSLAVLKSPKLGPRGRDRLPLVSNDWGTYLVQLVRSQLTLWFSVNGLNLRSRIVPVPPRSLETSVFLMKPQSLWLCPF